MRIARGVSKMFGSWAQTVAVIGSFILTTTVTIVTSALWIQSAHNEMMTTIVTIQNAQLAMQQRVEVNGWSRAQHQAWVDDLRALTEHDLPNLRPYTAVQRE